MGWEMKILYDGEIYAMQRAGGINRYFENLIARLPETYHPFLTANRRSPTINFPAHKNLRVCQYRDFRPSRMSNQLRVHYFRYCLARLSFDLVHPTYYSLLSRQELASLSAPLVITVHDMVHEIFADQLGSKDGTVSAKKKACLAAQAIICISENTRKDLIKYYPHLEEKISVIYQAGDLDSTLSYGNEPVPLSPYYLYVGSRTAAYKNFGRLLVAFSKAVSVNPDLSLCVVGPPFNESELSQIHDLGMAQHIEHYGYIHDRHLAKLYRCSLGLVYPSLYEGFGIPPLEAMKCGTVAIAANTSSIPEVVGDAGILFSPTATHDLADILLDLVERPTERERLIQKGFERSQLFSWDKTVAQTLEVYSSVTA